MKLLICESPNKVHTIKDILKKLNITDINVMASVGHIVKIADTGDYNMGIDVKNNFKIDYVVSEDKKEIVHKLKEMAKAAELVYLASDGDREGEVIAWTLKEFLKLSSKKYKRITYHELTPAALQKAFETARDIDLDLVAAGQARSSIDKMIGYRLSGIAKRNVGAKSVGRCQSAGLKLVVDKELEIRNFVSKTFYELWLSFEKDKKRYQAKYIGTESKKVNQFEDEKQALKVLNECKDKEYFVKSITGKERKLSPKPPFTTSTYQQECASKLGMSIDKAMYYAQKLFEGININGAHQGLITYIRTDSSEMAPEFIDQLKDFIISNCGKEYYAEVKKGKKKATDQDGHEAIRPVDLNMTPSALSQYVEDEDLIKVYRLIYNRTLASSMSPAIINDTVYIFNNESNLFQMTLSQMVFNGFKAVYDYKDDSDDIEDKCSLKLNEKLEKTKLENVKKESKPPHRYTEASFVKKLEDLGIGRPSTYATIVKVILDKSRGYCNIENKAFVPTDLGINLCEFLDKSFPNTTNSQYTAELEKELDLISQGDLNSIDFLSNFYTDLTQTIQKVDNQGIPDMKVAEQIFCPNCGKPMAIKKGPYGLFFGCTGYPKCKTIQKIKPKS